MTEYDREWRIANSFGQEERARRERDAGWAEIDRKFERRLARGPLTIPVPFRRRVGEENERAFDPPRSIRFHKGGPCHFEPLEDPEKIGGVEFTIEQCACGLRRAIRFPRPCKPEPA